MPSNYTGDPATFTPTLSLLDDSDPPAAALWRVPESRLLDNDAYLQAQRLARDALTVRPLSGLLDFADPDPYLAAVDVPSSLGPGVMLLKAGTEDTKIIYPDDCFYFCPTGSVHGITSAVRGLAFGNGIFVAIGTGGNLNCHTTNGGSWTEGGAGIGGAVQHLVYVPANALAGGGNKFLSGGTGTGSVYYSPDSATIWQAIGSNFPAVLGLAVLSSGFVVALGASGGKPRFSVLTDGVNGADFAGSVAPPNASTANEAGSLCGAPASPVGGAVYHAMRCDSGARIRTASSVDGTTWSSGAVFEAPFGRTFTTAPRLMACPTTGLIVLACTLNTGPIALYATRDFVNWAGPRVGAAVIVGGLEAYAVAGGRLFVTRPAPDPLTTSIVYASDGVGSY